MATTQPIVGRRFPATLFMAVAVVLATTVSAGLIQPRSLTVLAPFALVVLVGFGWRNGLHRGSRADLAPGPTETGRRVLASAGEISHRLSQPIAPQFGVPTLLAAFFVFALASSAWSPAPLMSLEKTAVGIAFAALVVVGARCAANFDTAQRIALSRAIAIGFLIGSVFLAIEIWAERALSVAITNMLGLREGQVNPAKFMVWRDGRLASIDISALTRSMAAVVLLLPAALMAVATTLTGSTRTIAMMMTVVAALVAIGGSDSQTAKLALITGTLTVVLARLNAKWARRALTAVWLIACLAIVPLAFIAQGSNLTKHRLNQALPSASPAVRIEILNAYAVEVIKRPLIGHGVNSSYVLGPERDAEVDADGETSKGGMRQHPHNVYMQVWFELGAIGAGLFALIGLAVLRAIASAPERVQPLYCATFAIIATVLAPSYGMWQYWFMAAIAFAVFATMAVAHTDVGSRRSGHAV